MEKPVPMGRLAEIWKYPLKSGKGVSLERAHLHPWGVEGDRRFVVYDPNQAVFLSQRRCPELGFVSVTENAEEVELTALGKSWRGTTTSARREDIDIWGTDAGGFDLGDQAAEFLEQLLGRPARLLSMGDSHLRDVRSKHTPGRRVPVGYADAFPFSVASRSSLAILNERAGASLEMQRFRPNLVVEGFEGFAEDHWAVLRIGSAVFDLTKPCDRCRLTTLDVASQTYGKEPLKTLATFRRVGKNVYFAENALLRERAEVQVGDEVEVLERRPKALSPLYEPPYGPA